MSFQIQTSIGKMCTQT